MIGALTAIYLAALVPSAAFAGDWQLMHLADRGGAAMLQVDSSDADTSVAYADSSDGYRVSVSCTKDRTSLSIGRVGFREPFAGAAFSLEAVFDQEPPVKLGMFTYAGGSYSAPFQPQIVVRFATREKLFLVSENGEISVSLSLQGAGDAISTIHCLGGKP